MHQSYLQLLAFVFLHFSAADCFPSGSGSQLQRISLIERKQRNRLERRGGPSILKQPSIESLRSSIASDDIRFRNEGADKGGWPFHLKDQLDFSSFPQYLKDFRAYRLVIQCTRNGSTDSTRMKHCNLYIVEAFPAKPSDEADLQRPRALRFHVLGVDQTDLNVIFARGRYMKVEYLQRYFRDKKDRLENRVEELEMSRTTLPENEVGHRHGLEALEDAIIKAKNVFGSMIKKDGRGPDGCCIFFICVAVEVLHRRKVLSDKGYLAAKQWYVTERAKFRAGLLEEHVKGQRVPKFSWKDNEDELGLTSKLEIAIDKIKGICKAVVARAKDTCTTQ